MPSKLHLMRIPLQKLLLLIVLTIALFAVSCGEGESDANRDIIATVGDSKIELRELKESFVLSPNYPLRVSVRKAREYQLDYLINQRYYFLAAKRAKLQDDSLVSKRLTFIRNQEILKAYIKEEFVEQTTISDLELVRGMAKFKRKVAVQHLFSPDSAGIVRYLNRLAGGQSFEDIAKDIYTDEYLRNSGGDLGFISFGDLEEPLEEAAYNLEPGHISPPIKSAHGYHLIRVGATETDSSGHTMTTAMQMDMVRDQIRNRKIDKIIRAQLSDLGDGKQIAINNRMLDVVWRAINAALGEKYRTPGPFVLPINNGELSTIEMSLDQVVNEPIAQFDGKLLHVGELLDQIEIMPPLQRPYLRSKRNIAQFIINGYRRKLLLRKAVERGIDQQKRVLAEIDYHSTQVLTHEAFKRLRSDVFRELFPQQWQELSDAFTAVKATSLVKKNLETLVADLPDADSMIVKPPIPMRVQNRYLW